MSQFEIKNLKELLVCQEVQSFEDKANIVPVLLNISISTLRGIIVTRTAGTPLASFPLPVVDIRQVIRHKKEKQG